MELKSVYLTVCILNLSYKGGDISVACNMQNLFRYCFEQNCGKKAFMKQLGNDNNDLIL